jgi:exodeoxyribonuclease V gamma subunit
VRIERATSVEDLVVGLAAELATRPPAGVLDTVEIAVPSRGMERWLAQRLACDLGALDGEAGVCANIDFPFPGAVVTRALGAVLGGSIEADPWAPERLAWPVLAHLDDLPDDDVHAPLRAHLADGTERAERRRFPLARRIADLFDRYAMYRPDMVGRWADGDDVDAEGQPLPANVAWQPPLWRRLRATLDTASPDARFRAALDALAHGRIADPDALPERITIFGVLSLPPLHLQLLDALGDHTQVTIHALTPCTTWTPDEVPLEVGQPLLASCGMAALDAHGALARYERPAGPAGARQLDLGLTRERAVSRRRPGRGDLGAGGAAGRHPRGSPPRPQRHPARGAGRGRPKPAGPRLPRPHAPARGAARGAARPARARPRPRAARHRGAHARHRGLRPPHPGRVLRRGPPGDRDGGTGVPALPFRVADRTVRDENVAARVLLTVLELVTARVGASEVLDLLATPPVAARFGLTAADITTLPTWVLGTGISWGIDADHRDELIGLDDASHTWRAGLDRLVLGAAMPDDGERMVGGVVPYDDVEGGGVELLGRLTTATDALFACLRTLRRPRTVIAWRDALAEVVDTLLDPGPGPRRDPQLTAQLAAVREALSTMVAQSHGPDDQPSDIELTLEEVRAVLGSHLGQRGGRAQYGTGAVTFAGLVPLRNVPHRVVCLVGLDDGALPRTTHRHGFDLIAAQPRAGDPDERIEDRALLLDAVLSARATS